MIQRLWLEKKGGHVTDRQSKVRLFSQLLFRLIDVNGNHL